MCILNEKIVEQTNDDIIKARTFCKTVFRALYNYNHNIDPLGLMALSRFYSIVVDIPNTTTRTTISFRYSVREIQDEIIKDLMNTFMRVAEKYNCKIGDIKFIGINIC